MVTDFFQETYGLKGKDFFLVDIKMNCGFSHHLGLNLWSGSIVYVMQGVFSLKCKN